MKYVEQSSLQCWDHLFLHYQFNIFGLDRMRDLRGHSFLSNRIFTREILRHLRKFCLFIFLVFFQLKPKFRRLMHLGIKVRLKKLLNRWRKYHRDTIVLDDCLFCVFSDFRLCYIHFAHSAMKSVSSSLETAFRLRLLR